MELPVDYNKAHFPRGLNGDFVGVDADALRAKFAGEKGVFENTEKRDIARAAAQIAKIWMCLHRGAVSLVVSLLMLVPGLG